MKATITGKTISGNYIGQPRRSCKRIDVPTSERVEVELDGRTYQRTVHERRVWRNMGEATVEARFVTIGGTNYEVR